MEKNKYKTALRRFRLKISPGHIFVLGFIAVILTGSLLLSLPIATREGAQTDYMTALFTSVSATCVTGLIVADTYTNWSWFGQIVILIMIQLGGLGFMSLLALLSFFMKRSFGLKERLVIVKSFNLNDMSDIERVTRHVLVGTAIIEGSGALLLSIRFIKDFGVAGGIIKGIFTAVSAFCNAGFDLMGERSAYSSLVSYAGDPIVNIVVMLLIVIGGIGFFVWEDVWENRGFTKLQLHSKIAICATAVLIIGGASLFYIWERDNPSTMAGMNEAAKVTASFFQSVTVRTAGFNTIDQGGLTNSSRALSIILMTIGGSPGSTAGGIKTVTAVILLLASVTALRGRSEVVIAKRSIAPKIVFNALALIMLAILLIMTASFAITHIEGLPFEDILFETASAFGTVGLSVGITPSFGMWSRIILMAMMFMGRVGVLTIGYTVLSRLTDSAKMKYPEANLMIG